MGKPKPDSKPGNNEVVPFPEGVYQPHSHELNDDEHEPNSERIFSGESEEANAVSLRLQSEGIPCDLDVTDEADGDVVHVSVRPTDVEDAKDILARAPKNRKAQQEFEDEFYEQQGICPKCPDQFLELEPFPRPLRIIRRMAAVWFIAPIIGWVVEATSHDSMRELPSWVLLVWAIGALVLGLLAVSASPKKFCPNCGWRPGLS